MDANFFFFFGLTNWIKKTPFRYAFILSISVISKTAFHDDAAAFKAVEVNG